MPCYVSGTLPTKLPAKIFGAARIRGYLVLQEQGLYDAVDMQILDRVLAGHLWLPYSLIEIGFRNGADRIITVNHARQDRWLTTKDFAGGEMDVIDVLSARDLRRSRDGVSRTEPPLDGDLDDPVGDAARMAGRQTPPRERIARDDLIAHLMLGFWVLRCPSVFVPNSGKDFWSFVAAEWPEFKKTPEAFATTMQEVLRTRNRIAHHEPLMIRATNIFTKNQAPKKPADLIVSLEATIEQFTRKVERANQLASVIAPQAATHLDRVPENIKNAIQPLRESLSRAKEAARERKRLRLASPDPTSLAR